MSFLSGEAKERLREMGVDPDEEIVQEIRCKKIIGQGRACRRHIATVYLERVGHVLRIDGGPKGYVTPNLEREPALSLNRTTEAGKDARALLDDDVLDVVLLTGHEPSILLQVS